MIVYNCYLHELFILQSYIFSVRKRKKAKFAFFSSVFAQKLQEIRFMRPKTQKDDLAKRKVIFFYNWDFTSLIFVITRIDFPKLKALAYINTLSWKFNLEIAITFFTMIEPSYR